MLSRVYSWLSAATFATTVAALSKEVPHLEIPKCSDHAMIHYDRSVPSLTDFPLTHVHLCWEPTGLNIGFIAYNETNFVYNKTMKTNDPIWQYEVMETFIAPGDEDPTTYLEFEVAPNNITFNAFIYNPSKVRDPGAPFGTDFIENPIEVGLTSSTTLDRKAQTWISSVHIPFQLWGIEGSVNTTWRMNFFRTVTTADEFPEQQYGAWSPPDAPNFHMTPFFGHVKLV